MSTGKMIVYVLAAILVFFGVLFLWAAFGSETASPGGRLAVGILFVALGLGIIVAVRLREPKPKQEVVIKQQIDLSGDVNVQVLKCQSCGAQIDKSAISTAQGAVVVNCPYCNATYQIVEEPKW